MKIIVSKALFETRKSQMVRLLTECEASASDINAVLNMQQLKEINTDLIKIVIDNDDVIIVIDDTLENELMEAIIDAAPLIMAVTIPLAVIAVATFKGKTGKSAHKSHNTACSYRCCNSSP